MKIAVVYNRESRSVINLFGVPNREKIGMKTIRRLEDALKQGGHQVTAFEGDKDLVRRLEEFMPRVVKGERPGLVFNVSYGIQGQARYTHVPSILEMVGIPYVASGPLAHTLALDKVVAKILFKQHGLPTPDFAVLEPEGFESPDLEFPLIVKPKNEAVSFGLKVVHDDRELREAAQVIIDKFQQPVLVERFIEGREVNVGIIGNNPAEPLPPVLLDFGPDGPGIYTYEDKTGRSGREIRPVCPAPIGEELTAKVQQLAVRAFRTLGLFDCARIDMRLDAGGNPWILEINSLPSLGEHGSYVHAAEHIGLDFPKLVSRLVDVAAERYFGTPHPPKISGKDADPASQVFQFITERRDRIERRLGEWIRFRSRTNDIVALRDGMKRIGELFTDLGMREVPEFTDRRNTGLWQTRAGFEDGTLLLGNLDVPLDPSIAIQPFRREPEWVFGEGVGSSRGPLVTLEFALRALRNLRRLRNLRLGVLYHADEGSHCQGSEEVIRKAAGRVRRVLVLRRGHLPHRIVTQRRGERMYRLVVEGRPRRPGSATKRHDVIGWLAEKTLEITALSSRKELLSVSVSDIRTEAYPMLLPHRLTVAVLVTFLDEGIADGAERSIRNILGKGEPRWELAMLENRPPMPDRRENRKLADMIRKIASGWEIPLETESSVWPSAAGLVPPPTAVVCAVGPVARDLYTPQEAVQRISLVQRTLLLAQTLLRISANG